MHSRKTHHFANARTDRQTDTLSRTICVPPSYGAHLVSTLHVSVGISTKLCIISIYLIYNLVYFCVHYLYISCSMWHIVIHFTLVLNSFHHVSNISLQLHKKHKLRQLSLTIEICLAARGQHCVGNDTLEYLGLCVSVYMCMCVSVWVGSMWERGSGRTGRRQIGIEEIAFTGEVSVQSISLFLPSHRKTRPL